VLQDSLSSPSDIGPVVSAVPSASSSVSSPIGPDISVVSEDRTDGAVRQEKSNGAVAGKAKKRSAVTTYKV